MGRLQNKVAIVTGVVTGAVNTDMYRQMNDTPEKTSFVNGLHALKRAAQPQELARSGLDLASDDSMFVTGTTTLVDGGASIMRA
jgi:NAD(P)-dependent dehydrogenase (short-subunit alcohol dehydrogenase family)